jgi:hypothetical protein
MAFMRKLSVIKQQMEQRESVRSSRRATNSKTHSQTERSHPQLRQHKHAHILHLLRFLPDLLALHNMKAHNDKPYRLSSAALEVVGLPADDIVRLGMVGRKECEPEQAAKVAVPELARRMLGLVVELVII